MGGGRNQIVLGDGRQVVRREVQVRVGEQTGHTSPTGRQLSGFFQSRFSIDFIIIRVIRLCFEYRCSFHRSFLSMRF